MKMEGYRKEADPKEVSPARIQTRREYFRESSF